MDKLLAVGKELGLVGSELKEWVEREMEKERQERQDARQERALARDAERQRLELEREVLDRKLRLEEARAHAPDANDNGDGGARGASSSDVISPHKLIPVFNDSRDDLDAYIQRFERVATGQGWPKEKWATTISLCLTGEALSVVGRLSPEDSLDYEKVKGALLQRFRYTAEGYREKFRGSVPEEGETSRQFVARLSGYFDRWMETGRVEKTYAGLREKIITEQFMTRCPKNLLVFLKERNCAKLKETVVAADNYLDAQEQRSLGSWPSEDAEDSPNRDYRGKTLPQKRVNSRPEKLCFLCDKQGHTAAECWKRTKACFKCDQSGHRADKCYQQTDENPQASCVVQPREESQKFVTLESGEKIPVVSAVREKCLTSLCNLPVGKGWLGGKSISVLRDTGCNTVIVRKELVPSKNFTGKISPVLLLDRTIKFLPEADIEVKTPFFSGNLTAKCMQDPLYDLVLGNVEGVSMSSL